jgi:hypothetical protein
MKGTHNTASLAIIVIFVLSLTPLSLTGAQITDYEVSFLLCNHPDGGLTYELNVTIPQTLYQYYANQNHRLSSSVDFPKFVTPTTLKPLADKLWQICNNSEDFTNGVLMLVHQITYREVIPGKYPVETLANGYGDCDLFAYIAASILKAGGIPTILLYYKAQEHMEIGVDIGRAPVEARVGTFHIEYESVSYYIGECTGSDWRTGWRIGETPSQYQNVSSQVIPLESIEQTSVGQVSVSLRQLDASSLSLEIFPPIMLENSNITVSGQVQPVVTNENVTLQAKVGTGWTTIGTVATQSDGRFVYDWMPTTDGIVVIHAVWQGNRQYNGATSAQTNVVVLPFYLVLLIVALVLAVALLVILLIELRRKSRAPPISIPPAKTALSVSVKITS